MGDKVDDSDRASRHTGPRTPQGKNRSKLNALKTGIFAKIVVSTEAFDETRSDFGKLFADFRGSINPRDKFEETLVEALALQFLRLARVYACDAQVAPLLFRSVREQFDKDAGDAAIAEILQKESVNASTFPAENAAKFPATDLLLRYESSIWKQIDRILLRIESWRRLKRLDSRQDVAAPQLLEGGAEQ